MRRPGWVAFHSWASGWSTGGNQLDQQGAALLASAKPTSGKWATGCWRAVRRSASGVLELTLSLVFVFFFYRDGPRLAAFVLRLLHRLMGERGGITWSW